VKVPRDVGSRDVTSRQIAANGSRFGHCQVTVDGGGIVDLQLGVNAQNLILTGQNDDGLLGTTRVVKKCWPAYPGCGD